RSTSVFGQLPFATPGTVTFLIGWNDQNARCASLMTYGGVVGLAGAGAAPGASDFAADAVVVAAAGHGAPARTRAAGASTSSGRRRPPFGIFGLSLVWRTA